MFLNFTGPRALLGESGASSSPNPYQGWPARCDNTDGGQARGLPLEIDLTADFLLVEKTPDGDFLLGGKFFIKSIKTSQYCGGLRLLRHI